MSRSRRKNPELKGKKSDLVTKVAEEQKLDPAKIDRLAVSELEKMDAVIPDKETCDPKTSETLEIPVTVTVPVKVTFKVQDSKDIQRKTPAKFRKFI